VVLVLGVLGGFARLGGQKVIYGLLIFFKKKSFKAINKNPLRSFKYEHTKKYMVFEK